MEPDCLATPPAPEGPYIVFGYIRPTGTRWIGWYSARDHAHAERQALDFVPGLVVVRSVMTMYNMSIDEFDTVSEMGAVPWEPAS
jgi:hypothetical protein